MGSLLRHWPRIVVTLLPLIFALLHAVGVLRLGVLDRLDNIIYDTRLVATMPKTLDDRIVIVDIDEKSLAQVGRWPWGRNKLSDLTEELFERQKIALMGFDVVFAEADESSGLKRLNELAQKELRDQELCALLDLDPGPLQVVLEARGLEVLLGIAGAADRDLMVRGEQLDELGRVREAV